MSPITVTRTYLELPSRDALRTARAPARSVELAVAHAITPAAYLALYRLVGERWHWRDRLAWTEQQLTGYLADPAVQVWVARVNDDTAGFFELKRAEGTVELMYFGLAPAYLGQGLGGWLLTRAVEEAFALHAERVILNTCTLDSPHALPNYLARGFRIVRTEEYEVRD